MRPRGGPTRPERDAGQHRSSKRERKGGSAPHQGPGYDHHHLDEEEGHLLREHGQELPPREEAGRADSERAPRKAARED